MKRVLLIGLLAACADSPPTGPLAFHVTHYDYTFDVESPAAHPDGFKTRCPGTVTDKSATETTCDFTLAGGPTYSTFGVATYNGWTETDKGSWGGVHVTLYDRASTKIDAAIDSTWHDGYLQ